VKHNLQRAKQPEAMSIARHASPSCTPPKANPGAKFRTPRLAFSWVDDGNFKAADAPTKFKAMSGLQNKAKQKAAPRKSSRISTYANVQPRPMHCRACIVSNTAGQ
jgi:hypothetical protein